MPQVIRREPGRVRPTERPAANFAPLGLGSAQHIEAQRMAMAAGDLAGVVAQMAALNAKAKATQEMADFTAADAKGYNDFKIAFGREVEDRLSDPQSADPNFVGPAEPLETWVQRRYKEWAKEHSKEITANLTMKGAREEAANRLKVADAGRINEIKLDALDREANFIEASIPKTLMEFVQTGNARGAKEYVEELRVNGLLDAARKEFWEQKIDAYEAEWTKETAVAILETQWLGIMDSGGPQEEAQKLVKETYDAGLIGAGERVKQDNKVETAFARRSKKAAMDAFEKATATYRDFAQKLMTADLTMDDVERGDYVGTSDEKEDKRAEFREIVLSASREKEPPKRSRAGGSETVRQAVLKHARGVISVHTAYDSVIKARYDDRSITDDEYKWAVDRLNNPYPRQTAVDLESVLGENEKDLHGWRPGIFRKPGLEEKELRVQRGLIDYLEESMAKEKDVTLEDMRVRSAELMSGGGEREPEPTAEKTEEGRSAKIQAQLEPYVSKLDAQSEAELMQVIHEGDIAKLRRALEILKEKYGSVR